MRGLAGRVVVVAGAATGLGAATAGRLGEEGAHVVVGDLDGDAATEVAERIRSAGGSAISVGYDAAEPRSVEALAAAAVDEFGALHGWHNNAAATGAATVGVDLEHDALDVPDDVWERTMAVNLRGYLAGVRAAVPRLLAAGGGAMVHTASDGAFAGQANLVAYNASKSAILSLNRHVAARWGREGIRSNVVSPGAIMSESLRANLGAEVVDAMVRASSSPRAGEPGDIAAAVAFLLSDDAAWINGQVLSVNGGTLMR